MAKSWKNRRRILALLCSLLVWGLVACRSREKSPAPASAVYVSPDGAKLSQNGFASEPARIDRAESLAKVPLPKGSALRFFPPFGDVPPKIEITIPQESALELSTNSDAVSLPKSFPPPAGPSARETALAESLKWFHLGGIAFAVGALLLLWRGHGKAAGIAGIGAIGVPLLGNFVSSDAALWISIACSVAAISLFAAWHLVRRRLRRPND